MYMCSISEEGCADLVSALKSNPSHLRELNLSANKPGESGVKLLSGLLEDPHCKLEKLQAGGGNQEWMFCLHIPVPKKSSVSCLNDHRPVTLTPVIMKCFERLVIRHIKTLLPPSLDPLQFAYRPNRSTDDAISTILHLPLTHLDNRDTYVRMLFIDFSSAFNTIIPQHLIGKLNLLGLNTSISNWILDWETSQCTARTTTSFADDTTVVGLISKNDESAYREEVQRLRDWCRTNNLSLNIDKTKEMVVDFRRTRRDHSPLHIDGSTVEIIKSTKFLGVHLAEDLTWSLNTSTVTKKAQQRLYFLRRLRKAHLPPPILTTFYRGTIESILSGCITACFGNCTASDRKSLHRVVRTDEKIIGVSLPTITDLSPHPWPLPVSLTGLGLGLGLHPQLLGILWQSAQSLPQL
ncbi:hypothetical protein NFI96_004028 [Prochilodus magdalenae]|nr:hypothetical protein NFI96_004028 [Prochilodus magdalenae]